MLTSVVFPALGMIGLLLMARLEDRLSTGLRHHLDRPDITPGRPPAAEAPAAAAAAHRDLATPLGPPAAATLA